MTHSTIHSNKPHMKSSHDAVRLGSKPKMNKINNIIASAIPNIKIMRQACDMNKNNFLIASLNGVLMQIQFVHV